VRNRRTFRQNRDTVRPSDRQNYVGQHSKRGSAGKINGREFTFAEQVSVRDSIRRVIASNDLPVDVDGERVGANSAVNINRRVLVPLRRNPCVRPSDVNLLVR